MFQTLRKLIDDVLVTHAQSSFTNSNQISLFMTSIPIRKIIM